MERVKYHEIGDSGVLVEKITELLHNNNLEERWMITWMTRITATILLYEKKV